MDGSVPAFEESGSVWVQSDLADGFIVGGGHGGCNR